MIADETADPEMAADPRSGRARSRLTRRPGDDVGVVRTSSTRSNGNSSATAPIAGPAGVTTARSRGRPTRNRRRADGRPGPRAPRDQHADDDFFSPRCATTVDLHRPWSTVAYSDKGMAGTNHVLPTAGGARHRPGCRCPGSSSRSPTSAERAATPLLAEAVDVISGYEGMAAHRATATLRLERLRQLTSRSSQPTARSLGNSWTTSTRGGSGDDRRARAGSARASATSRSSATSTSRPRPAR